MGDQAIESSLDSNVSGWAKAFPFTDQIAGTASSISVYVDRHNQATKLLVGLYSDVNRKPGTLMTSGSLSSPKAGSWNTVSVGSANVQYPARYWVAVLGRGGTLYFRDRASGPCYSVNSSQTSLNSLPESWTSGPALNTCPISAYVGGTAVVVAQSPPPSSSPPPPSSSPPPPPSNSALPQVTGTSPQGDILTTSHGSWSGSPTSYAYRWQDCDSSGANCTSISGATSNGYPLTSNDVGHTIRAVVTATNSGGSASATSVPTAVVSAPPTPPPSNTGLPQITGTPTQGDIVTTSNGLWIGSPGSYAYQWQDCDSSGNNCTNISGATASTYTLTSNDVAHTMRAVVTATNGVGSTSATSNQTSGVAATSTPPPSNTALPVISGTTTQGQTLSSSNGSWSGSPSSYAYQWRQCDSSGSNCTNISGVTSSSYTLTSGDVGHTIRIIVTATNAGGSTSATSNQTGSVAATSGGGSAPVNTVGPYFTASTGTTTACSAGCAIVGQVLTVSTGTWGPAPTSYTYQWNRCTTTSGQPPTTSSCSTISGATSSSYTVASADAGHSLIPVVTAYNGTEASTPTSASGKCNTGEIVATGISSSPEPTTPIAGCSPISAVAATTQQTEKFCTNSATTCGFADPMNGTAGVPAGTTPSTTGACATWTNGGTVSTANTVIKGCKITGGLTINANNVTVENSDITGDNSTGPIISDQGNTGTQFLHDSIHGTTPSGNATAAWAIEGDNVTEDHVYVYNVDRILMMYPNDGSSSVTNSFCWMNGQAGSEHHECIYNGGGSNLTANNDALLNLQAETADIFYDNPDYGGSGTTGALDAENDIFSGGTYTIYGGDGNAGTSHTGHETFTNDRWSRLIYPTGGQYGAFAYIPSGTTSTGNIWDDTGGSVGGP